MFLMNAIQEIVDAGAQQLLAWVTAATAAR